MPAGKIEEIVEGSGWYKIRTDYDDRTTYEVQNRAKAKVEVTMDFHVAVNINFEAKGATKQVAPTTFVITVGPGETDSFVTLRTADDGKDWTFDYKFTAKVSDDPEWL